MAGNSPCSVGTAAELFVAARAAANGFTVLMPWGHSQSYDMVIDAVGHLSRVQVKNAAYRAERDRYEVDVRTVRYIRGAGVEKVGSSGVFDVLAVVCEQHVYLIPELIVRGRTSLVLRPPSVRKRGNTGPALAFDPEDWLEAWPTLKGGE